METKQLSLLFILGYFFLFSCNSINKNTDSFFPVINIEEGLKNFKVDALSNYISDIDYIKLETNDKSLISGDIDKIFLEKNKIFIQDKDAYVKVFDARSGKYLYNIGSTGLGPGEMPYLYHVDLNIKENSIILGWSDFINQFDLNGTFLKRIYLPVLSDQKEGEKVHSTVTLIKENVFTAGVLNPEGNQTNAAIIFNDQQKILSKLKSYRDMIKDPSDLSWSPFDQAGFFYRKGENVFHFRGLSDTIYIYNDQDNAFQPHIWFNFGKHTSMHDLNSENENKDVVRILTLVENDQFLFMDCYAAKASPEPFKETIWRDGVAYEYTNNFIYGIFDKHKRKTHFLLQPIKNIRGLKNDVDNGIPFWPQYISSQKEWIDYHQAYKFIEYAKTLSNPSPAIKEIINELNEEDNPIIIIAKEKKEPYSF